MPKEIIEQWPLIPKEKEDEEEAKKKREKKQNPLKNPLVRKTPSYHNKYKELIEDRRRKGSERLEKPNEKTLELGEALSEKPLSIEIIRRFNKENGDQVKKD